MAEVRFPLLAFRLQEAAVRICSTKYVFLNISQNSQESTCTGVSSLKKLRASSLELYQKILQSSCFPVNFVKCLRTVIL